MDPPIVFVRNSPLTYAYLGRSGDDPVLVLTSALLNLYEGVDDELRFVIGHELGHAKCGHVGMRRASHGILEAIRQIDLTAVPDDCQRVLPTLAAGRFFSWCREAEISADRAGLLCCGDPQTASSALLRLLHGLKAGDSRIDPNHPQFDPDAAIREFERWENEPFVHFVMWVQKFPREAPFIVERVAALKNWADTGAYEEILARQTPPDANGLLEVKRIVLVDVGSDADPVDVYLVVFSENEELFQTPTVSEVTAATWSGFEHSHRCMDGQPLFFEIWEDNYFRNALLGGFVIYPRRSRTTYVASVLWDWKERSDIARSAAARVEVKITGRAK